MARIQNSETRYFIDLDLKTQKIIRWDYDQRKNISVELNESSHLRIFITKGQYNRLEKKSQDQKK